MIAVIDYHKGNLKSVERGLCDVGADARITSNLDDIRNARALVLPGVGSFADAAETMERLGQIESIRDRVERGVPFLGICLGLHLLFEGGTEGSETKESGEYARGLGILPGIVDRLSSTDSTGKLYKIPHVGWNSIEFSSEERCALLKDIEPGEFFYFTHSYVAPESEFDVATTTHSMPFPSMVEKDGYVFGVQFHPEKSSRAGARLLKNFLDIVESRD